MKKFLKNLFLFGLFFFIFDKLFFIPQAINPHQVIDQRIHQTLKGEHEADILILGSSRASRNILAGMIENRTGKKTLNFSYPGSNIEFHEFLLRLYLKNQKNPELVFLTMDDNTSFYLDQTLEFRYNQLYPLTLFHDINKEFIVRKEKSILAYLFALERVSKSTFDFGEKVFTKYDSISSNGSMPVTFQSENFEGKYISSNNDYLIIDEVNSRLTAFKNIQTICKQNNIELIILFSPNFKNLNLKFLNRVKELMFWGDVDIYDTLNPVYKDPSLFHDTNHLIYSGAEVYTTELVEMLSK